MGIGGIDFGMSGSWYGSGGSMYAGAIRNNRATDEGQNGNIAGVYGNKTGDAKSSECQTCQNRKYVDGSDEMVSFKAPAHISPEAAGAAVRAHEQEHVSNAYKKAQMNNGKVINASVSIHMDTCPECGRTYVAGGTTSSTISYTIEKPGFKGIYDKSGNVVDSGLGSGQFIDCAVYKL